MPAFVIHQNLHNTPEVVTTLQDEPLSYVVQLFHQDFLKIIHIRMRCSVVRVLRFSPILSCSECSCLHCKKARFWQIRYRKICVLMISEFTSQYEQKYHLGPIHNYYMERQILAKAYSYMEGFMMNCNPDIFHKFEKNVEVSYFLAIRHDTEYHNLSLVLGPKDSLYSRRRFSNV